MRKLSLRERFLLIALAVVAAVCAYVLLFHMPMARRTEELNARIAQAEELSAQLEARLAEQHRMEAELEQLAAREDAPAPMPEYDNLQAVLVELNAVLAGCREYSISFQGEQTEDSVYCRRVTIPFSCGSYEEARTVLQRLHDSPLRSLLEDVTLSVQNDGSVRATASMTFFEYREPEPDGGAG